MSNLTAAPSGPAPSSTSRRPQNPRATVRLWPVVGAVVGIVVVISLIAAGAYPAGAPAGSANQLTYSQASTRGASAAAGVTGGPWSLVTAIGINSEAGFTSTTPTGAVANCTLQPAGPSPPPSTIHVPPDGAFASGGAPIWTLVYVNRVSEQILLIDVLNGTAMPLVVGTGPCTASFSALPNVAANVVDSPVAASAAWNDEGSTFVAAFNAAHPGVPLNQILALYSGGTIPGLSTGSLKIGPTWVVALTPCGLFGGGGPSGSQPILLTLVNATSGGIDDVFPTSEACTNLTAISPPPTIAAGLGPAPTTGGVPVARTVPAAPARAESMRG